MIKSKFKLWKFNNTNQLLIIQISQIIFQTIHLVLVARVVPEEIGIKYLSFYYSAAISSIIVLANSYEVQRSLASSNRYSITKNFYLSFFSLPLTSFFFSLLTSNNFLTSFLILLYFSFCYSAYYFGNATLLGQKNTKQLFKFTILNGILQNLTIISVRNDLLLLIFLGGFSFFLPTLFFIRIKTTGNIFSLNNNSFPIRTLLLLIIINVSNYMDRFVIILYAQYFLLEYAVLLSFSQLVVYFSRPFANLMINIGAEGNSSNTRKLLIYNASVSLICFLIVSFITFVLKFNILIYGLKWSLSDELILLFFLSFAIGNIIIPIHYFFIGRGNISKVIIVNLIIFLIAFPTMFTLGNWYSHNGVVFAKIIFNLLVIIISLVFLRGTAFLEKIVKISSKSSEKIN